MPSAFVTALQSFKTRFDNLETPDPRSGSYVARGMEGFTPEGMEKERKRKAIIESANQLNNAAGRLIQQYPDHAKRAGISDKALNATSPVQCWYATVVEIVGSTGIPSGQQSAIAIDLILARLSDENDETTNAQRNTLATMAPMNQSGANKESDAESQNQHSDQAPKNRAMIFPIVFGCLSAVVLLVTQLSGHWEEWYVKFLIVPAFVVGCGYAIAEILVVKGRLPWSVALAVSLMVTGALGAAALYLYLGDDMLKFYPALIIYSGASIVSLAIIALLFYAAHLLVVQQPQSKTSEVIPRSSPTSNPSTAPSMAKPPATEPDPHAVSGPTVSPTSGLPLVTAGELRGLLRDVPPHEITALAQSPVKPIAFFISQPHAPRSPIAILRGNPPPIDSLEWAAFGEGPEVEATQWMEATEFGEPLAERVKFLLRQTDPVLINSRNLKLPLDFLQGTPKKLKLRYPMGKLIALDENEQLSSETIGRKLKRIVDRDHPGLQFRSLTNFVNWPKYTLFTEYDFRKANPAFHREGPDSHLEVLEDHLKKGNIEIVAGQS
jgi:hypothetical protein